MAKAFFGRVMVKSENGKEVGEPDWNDI